MSELSTPILPKLPRLSRAFVQNAVYARNPKYLDPELKPNSVKIELEIRIPKQAKQRDTIELRINVKVQPDKDLFRYNATFFGYFESDAISMSKIEPNDLSEYLLTATWPYIMGHFNESVSSLGFKGSIDLHYPHAIRL